jgi:hypothetical protein
MTRIISMSKRTNRKSSIYDVTGMPVNDFNNRILRWLDNSSPIVNHQPPKAFETLRKLYDATNEEFYNREIIKGLDSITRRWQTHRQLLSSLTRLMLNVDIAKEIGPRLTAAQINQSGFRSTLSQGIAKNAGENFINLIVYALADALSFQDEILVDKGLPPYLRQSLKLKKNFKGTSSGERELVIPIECDMCIFSRTFPFKAIIVSAKTRLKEVFHVGTMWKLFFDMIRDEYCLDKWNLVDSKVPIDILYVFATADMIPSEGRGTQGPDVERDEVRNLIAMDASFFDYVFVSKQDIPHVSNSLDLANGRESLFHQLGCILDLITQKFAGSVIVPNNQEFSGQS